MAGGSRAANKELAAAKLACGSTVREAASAAGCDERTVYKWRATDAAFRRRIEELRSAAVEGALGRLSDTMTAAADVLAALLTNKKPETRLKAARAVIELGLRVRAEAETAARLDEIERRLNGEGDELPGEAREAGEEGCAGG